MGVGIIDSNAPFPSGQVLRGTGEIAMGLAIDTQLGAAGELVGYTVINWDNSWGNPVPGGQQLATVDLASGAVSSIAALDLILGGSDMIPAIEVDDNFFYLGAGLLGLALYRRKRNS